MIKVAVVGPESTGKSELCKGLAKHFKTVYVPEYSRQFLDGRNGQYDMSDLPAIARGQQYLIETFTKKKIDLLIIDTEAIVVKIWSKVKYQEVDPLIEITVKNQDFDLYLLCNTDLEWTYDPLREVPNKSERDRIFELFKTELEKHDFKYEIITGHGNKRLKQAISVIANLL